MPGVLGYRALGAWSQHLSGESPRDVILLVGCHVVICFGEFSGCFIGDFMCHPAAPLQLDANPVTSQPSRNNHGMPRAPDPRCRHLLGTSWNVASGKGGADWIE